LFNIGDDAEYTVLGPSKTTNKTTALFKIVKLMRV